MIISGSVVTLFKQAFIVVVVEINNFQNMDSESMCLDSAGASIRGLVRPLPSSDSYPSAEEAGLYL